LSLNVYEDNLHFQKRTLSVLLQKYLSLSKKFHATWRVSVRSRGTILIIGKKRKRKLFVCQRQ